MHPLPDPQPMPQPEPPKRRKVALPVSLAAAALLVIAGGWGLGKIFGAASPVDHLTPDEIQQREQIFHAQPAFKVTQIAQQDTAAKIATLPLPPEQKAVLTKSTTQAGQRLLELVVWDDVEQDGDVVHVDSAHFSQTVSLLKQPQTLYFPVADNVPITITGIRDGGGGITLGFTGSGVPVSLPVLGEGQSIHLYLF